MGFYRGLTPVLLSTIPHAGTSLASYQISRDRLAALAGQVWPPFQCLRFVSNLSLFCCFFAGASACLGAAGCGHRVDRVRHDRGHAAARDQDPHHHETGSRRGRRSRAQVGEVLWSQCSVFELTLSCLLGEQHLARRGSGRIHARICSQHGQGERMTQSGFLQLI